MGRGGRGASAKSMAGLLGGSVAKALKRYAPPPEIDPPFRRMTELREAAAAGDGEIFRAAGELPLAKPWGNWYNTADLLHPPRRLRGGPTKARNER